MSQQSRRQFLLSSAVAGAYPLLMQRKVLAQRNAEATRPNILLIVADDLAAWMCGCYGNQEIRTPNIDQLARLGTRFSQSFVVTPAGSPSRATLFTGRTPWQHGIHDFLTDEPLDNPPQGQKAPPPSFASEIMISDILAKEGYNCGYIGKWHLGNNASPGHGLEYTYTMPGGSSPSQNPTMSRNGKLVEEKGYLTGLMTQEATEFLDRQKTTQPFFLTIGYPDPHTPYEGHPRKFYDLYADTSFETVGWSPAAPNVLRDKEMLADTVGNLRKCAASLSALDAQIPVLLNKLRERELWSDTLIVFTSDNGVLLGRHGLWSDGLASDPANMFDEVMQVPLILSWPGKIPIEGTRPELVSFYDILPTLCEAAGAPLPAEGNLCGHSFLNLSRGRPLPRKQTWASTVFGYYRNTMMARDNRYKLIIRDKGEGPNELYNLRKDQRERINEFENAQYVTVRDRLRKRLDAWLEEYA